MKATSSWLRNKKYGTVRIRHCKGYRDRSALFEGTWEKYHKAKNDKFFDSTVTDEKIRDYFNQAAAAAKEVMDRGVWAIYSFPKDH